MTNIAQHAFNTQNKVTVLSDGSKLFSSDFDSKCKFDIHRFDQIKFLRKRIKSSFGWVVVAFAVCQPRDRGMAHNETV